MVVIGECIDLGIRGLENIFLECPYARAVLVKGGPGLGKTIIAIHFIDAGLKRGEEVLYINFFETLDEFINKSLKIGIDLRPYVENGMLHYFHEYVYSEKDKLLYFVDRILDTISSRSIKRVVIDTIDALTAILMYEEYRVFLLQLIQRIKELGAILLIIKESSDGGSTGVTYEEVLADIVIELSRKRTLNYEVKYFTITKSRYSNYIPVSAEYVIESSGLKLYSPYPYSREYQGSLSREYVPTGIPRLDEMLGGGIPYGSITCIKGPSGTFKTLIALSIAIYNASRGRRVVFTSYKESRDQIIHYIETLGYSYSDLRDYLEINSINPVYISPITLFNMLLGLLQEKKYYIRVADGTEAMLSLVDPMEKTRFLLTMLSSIKALGVTEIIVYNQSEPYYLDTYGLDYIADVIIATRVVEEKSYIRRQICVLKNKGGVIRDNKFYDIDFVDGKIVIQKV